MKKSILSVFTLATIMLVSCSEDDSVNPSVPGTGGENVATEGLINYTKATALTKPTWQDITLSGGTVTETLAAETGTSVDKTLSGIVELKGIYTVEAGATLTIEAGTEIVADKGAKVFFLIKKGAKIDVQGTSEEPVLMSSPNAEAADWGGLVILGSAVTTSGDANGEASPEIDTSLAYGGTEADDNSGSIKYLVLRGTGNSINPDSQYNGISFYAVGSGTVVENIAVIDGADDGVEFFGGSVNVTGLYLEDNLDDSVDWTEGYNGTIKNIYIENNVAFSTAFEGDGTNNNPTFENVTAVSQAKGIAFQFKKSSGATIKDLNLSGYDKEIQFRDEDQFIIENVILDESTVVIK